MHTSLFGVQSHRPLSQSIGNREGNAKPLPKFDFGPDQVRFSGGRDLDFELETKHLSHSKSLWEIVPNEAFYQKFEERANDLANDHPKFAEVWRETGEEDKHAVAASLYRDALDNPASRIRMNPTKILHLLALHYQLEQQSLVTVERVLKTALSTCEKQAGTGSLDLVKSHHRLAQFYERSHPNDTSAIRHASEGLRELRRVEARLKPKASTQAKTMWGHLWSRAKSHLPTQAALGGPLLNGQRHDLMRIVAEAHTRLNHLEEAKTAYEQLVDFTRRWSHTCEDEYNPRHHFSPGFPAYLSALEKLAEWHFQRGSLHKAKALLEKSLRLTESNYGTHHPANISPLKKLARIHETLGNTEQAQAFKDRAKDLSEQPTAY